MQLAKDSRDLLALFEESGVDYAVVGAFALAFHARPRFTGDLDVWVHASPANAVRVLDALGKFGFGGLGLSEADFLDPDQVVQLGHAPSRVDLLTGLTGVSNEAILQGRMRGTIGGLSVWFLGREELRKNKKALGRPQDLADLALLG